jgi:DNA-binding CsgD family transcriptional regulator
MKIKYNELNLELQLEIAKLYKDGMPSTQISKLKQISVGSVLKYAKLHNGITRSCSEAFRKYSLNQDYFEKIDTEDKAYWLGFLYADGHINKRNDIILGLSSTDRNHLYKLAANLESDIPIGFSKNGAVSRLALRSFKMVQDLMKIGMGFNKTYRFYIKINPDLEKHFWRGVVDGDGSIFRNKERNRLGFSLVGNKETIESFSKFIYHTIGIFLEVRPHKSIYQCGTNGIYAFLIADLLYKDSRFYLDRKKNAWVEARPEYENKLIKPQIMRLKKRAKEIYGNI